MNQQVQLSDSFDALRQRLSITAEQQLATPAIPLAMPVAWLGQQFELSEFEQQLLLLSAFAELEPDAAKLIAAAQGSETAVQPTLALALSIFDNPHWSVLSPERPLRFFYLLEFAPSFTAISMTLQLPERVLHFLLGLEGVDACLLATSRQLTGQHNILPSQVALVEQLASQFQSQVEPVSPVLQLCGADSAIKTALLSALVEETGYRCFIIDVQAVPSRADERSEYIRRWARELALQPLILALDFDQHDSSETARAAVEMVEFLQQQVILLTRDPIPLSLCRSLSFELPKADSAEQADLWQQYLGDYAAQLNGTVNRLANHFYYQPSQILSIVAELSREKLNTADQRQSPQLLDSRIWQLARQQARPRLESLAQRIERPEGWNHQLYSQQVETLWQQLILPSKQKSQLKMLTAQVRQRGKVQDQWGFARLSNRGQGVSGLFVGSSGTGKTLAAEIVAATLGLDLYRIDLAAIVSKWIGETEKNLKRIFDAAEYSGAVLLFDEADALFGKRSEVKDSHDRHANLQVSYLLQRLENYQGLVLLTSNYKDNIDTAFTRRLSFIIEFPFPEASLRTHIWSSSFPDRAPLGELNFERLAQLNIAGGSIKNIAQSAAYLAAEQQSSIEMSHLLAAARCEYSKSNRSLTDREIQGWSV